MAEAIALLLKHGISGAPVIDGPSRLIGMLSEADCMRPLVSSRFHSQGSPHDQLVEAIMSRDLTIIAPDTDIYSIADRFLSDGLRRLPVVSQGELMGQVSRRDVLQAIQNMG
jgi:CBS domain-containing protein